MAKRQATSNLDHTNWDQEEEPEEQGTFKTASPEELNSRVIKKARRKVTAAPFGENAVDSADKKSVFSGFSGFSKSSVGAGGASPFAFLSSLSTEPTIGAPPLTGFSKNSSKDESKATFSFGTKPLTESTSSNNNVKKMSTSMFGGISSTTQKSPSKVSSYSAQMGSSDKEKPIIPNFNKSTEYSTEFRDKVAELNLNVLDFLKEHLEKDPYCILTPVFNDYETHFKMLQDENAKTKISNTNLQISKANTPTTSVGEFSFGKTVNASSTIPHSTSSKIVNTVKKPNCTVTSGTITTATTTPLFSFGNVQTSTSLTSTGASMSSFSTSSKPTPTTDTFSFMANSPAESTKSDTSKTSLFSFGAKNSDSKTDVPTLAPKANGFTFGFKSDDKASTSSSIFGNGAEVKSTLSTGFSFTPGATPFTFGNLKPPTVTQVDQNTNDGDDNEDDSPPKVEFKQVLEDDASYSIRCKVFFKKDGEFSDRGVGTLYLKPVKESEKTQMLVRADTNLGNILVNLILSDGIPCERKGNNNVMMVCVPTPEFGKTIPILLRVKSSDKADELLNEIQKHQK